MVPFGHLDSVEKEKLPCNTNPLEQSQWSATSRNGQDSVYLDFDADTYPGFVVFHAAVDCDSQGFVEDLRAPYKVARRDAVREARGLADLAEEWFTDNNYRRWSGKRRMSAFVKAVAEAVAAQEATPALKYDFAADDRNFDAWRERGYR